LYAAGVQLSVNSDDSSMLNTTLNQDVERLHSAFGLDLDAIDDILLNGVRHSFLPAERKLTMETEFRLEMAHLRKELCLL